MWDMSIFQVVPKLRLAAPRDGARVRELLREAVEDVILKHRTHTPDSAAAVFKAEVLRSVTFGTDAGIYPHGDNARQLAEAARAQAERAREIAAANDDCDRQSDNQQAVVTVLDPTPAREAQEYSGDYVFSTVYFGFDSSSVSTEAGSTLQAHARYLQENPSVRLRLEGHCDDAGTSEYNFALGQRRAAVVRQFLMELGISGERLSTLSYGEEMPDRSGNHDRNRRVEFVASE